MEPIDLSNIALKNLPNRLMAQAKNVESDGWLNAARLMRNASEILKALHEHGAIKLELDND